MNLLEWCVHYAKARDAIEQKLKSMDEKPDRIVCHYKDKEVTFLPMEKLATDLPAGLVTIVCVQNQQNFDTLVENFSEYSKNPGLTIIFLNPKLDEKWLIKPAIHAAVADKASLKTGLLTLYQMVPEV